MKATFYRNFLIILFQRSQGASDSSCNVHALILQYIEQYLPSDIASQDLNFNMRIIILEWNYQKLSINDLKPFKKKL